jgi:hypothetical protein
VVGAGPSQDPRPAPHGVGRPDHRAGGQGSERHRAHSTVRRPALAPQPRSGPRPVDRERDRRRDDLLHGRGHVRVHPHAAAERRPGAFGTELRTSDRADGGGSRGAGRGLRLRDEDHDRGRPHVHRAHRVHRRILGADGDGPGRGRRRHRPGERRRQPRTGRAIRPQDPVGVVPGEPLPDIPDPIPLDRVEGAEELCRHVSLGAW